YIHPFEDGNGRIHRLLMHHELTRRGFNPPGLSFPVSAAILERIQDYRSTLESYSARLLPMIDWEPTQNGNLIVLNDTADFYRYFDATTHTEFLYMCVEHTIETILPREVAFLQHYDRFQKGMSEIVEMPSSKIDLLHRFLQQNGGRLSKRAKSGEFAALTEEETEEIESLYKSCFETRN
ncbi:MAG: Fic family protein, partial [Candidatus Aegiribacteria sp.]|nr:Fic family protein [Candidatus Aegiribacteria sp.]